MRPVAGHKPQEERKQYSADDSNKYRVDKAARSGVAQMLHDKAADHGSDDADDDVPNGSETRTFHEFAGKEPCNQTYDNPPDDTNMSAPPVLLIRFRETDCDQLRREDRSARDGQHVDASDAANIMERRETEDA